MHSIIKPWSFRGWVLDIIGEIHPSSSRDHHFILVGIYYFTKWIEAIPLSKVDQKTVNCFIQNHILYRFGIPETITTNQGSVFIGQKMVEFSNQTCFTLLISTPYYSQANGEVKASNKILINFIKKHVHHRPKKLA